MCDLNKLIDIYFSDINISESNITEKDEIKYFKGNYNDFFHGFLIPNQPCIIQNVTDQWKCKDVWVCGKGPNIAYLRERYGINS